MRLIDVREQNLLELVANEMTAEHCQADAPLLAFYNNTLGHIVKQKEKEGPLAEKYAEIQL